MEISTVILNLEEELSLYSRHITKFKILQVMAAVTY